MLSLSFPANISCFLSLCATIFTIITCPVRVWRPISLLLIEFLQIQCWRVPLKFIEPNETLFKSRSNNRDASLVFVRCILFIVEREKLYLGVKKKKKKRSIQTFRKVILFLFFHFYRKFFVLLDLFFYYLQINARIMLLIILLMKFSNDWIIDCFVNQCYIVVDPLVPCTCTIPLIILLPQERLQKMDYRRKCDNTNPNSIDSSI